jgi:UDP-N-acetylmuramoylalanine--D-glutamate ligase
VITAKAFRGKRYAVLGLARSGVATVHALLASGAEVLAWDSREEARDELLRHAELVSASTAEQTPKVKNLAESWTLKQVQGDGVLTFADPLTTDLTGYDGIIVSPGVPINRHPIADKAKADGVPLIGDIELFAQARAELPPHKVVGITGTNGKSTTTALIHHILKTSGIPTMMGGNIGLPILGQEPLPEGGVYVLELSSFQIDLTYTLDCDVAVLTNITPDHLDRYDGFADYAASKERLFVMQHVDKVAVVATDDDPSRMIASRINHRLHRVSLKAVGDQQHWPSLQGPHNAQNVAVSVAVAQSLGLGDDAIETGLRTYPGLPHRMERIKELNGVLYVNDSKATNATSTAPALAAYPAVHWIAGGQAKTKDLDACAPHFGHVKAAYTIGEAGAMFADILSPHMPVQNSGTLEAAIHAARAAAKPGEVVLLSPACASFDQFKDFEDRGNQFRAIVEGLS